MKQEWKTMESAPQNGSKILAFCVHKADPYFDHKTNRLTEYGANAELLGHVNDGLNIIMWHGECKKGNCVLPAWWGLADVWEHPAANPVAWMSLPDSLEDY